jgi:uncharacterized UPF0160 family protein
VTIFRTSEIKILEQVNILLDYTFLSKHLNNTEAKSMTQLIYNSYYKEILQNLNQNVFQKHYQTLLKKMYNNLFSLSEEKGTQREKYPDLTSLKSRIERIKYEGINHENFIKCLNLVYEEYSFQLHYMFNSFIPSYEIVRAALNDRKNIHRSGKIIYLLKSCRWIEHLFGLENYMCIEGMIDYVIFQNENGFMIQAVPLRKGKYKYRKGLYIRYRGLENEEFCKASGIKDGKFVHVNGFIGATGSFKTALELAELSLYDRLS